MSALAFTIWLAWLIMATAAFIWLPPLGAALFCALAGAVFWWEWRDLRHPDA